MGRRWIAVRAAHSGQGRGEVLAVDEQRGAALGPDLLVGCRRLPRPRAEDDAVHQRGPARPRVHAAGKRLAPRIRLRAVRAMA